jgi:hypothetical protein
VSFPTSTLPSTADLGRAQELDDQPLEPADHRNAVLLLYSVE